MNLTGVALVEHLRLRIASDAASVAEIANIEREITRVWGEGRITDDEYQSLREEAHARRQRQHKSAVRHAWGTTVAAVKAVIPTAQKRLVDPAGAERTVKIRIISAEERAGRNERLRERRRIARLAAWEATYAAMFTLGEQAALSVVLLQCREVGHCTLAVKAIAARAKVCRRVVQNALKKAASWLVEIKRRFRNTSIITAKLQALHDWWRKSHAPVAEVATKTASHPLENPSSLSFRKDPLQGAEMCTSSPEIAVVEVVAPPVQAPEPEPEPTCWASVRKLTAANPKMVPMPPAPVPESERRTAFDKMTEAMEKMVAAASAGRTDADRAMDDWERPDIQGWMSSYQQAFIRQYRSYLNLEPSRWPQIYNDKGTEILPEIMAWLRERNGASGIGFGLCNLGRSGVYTQRVLWLGFAEPQNGVEFKMNFSGPKR